MWKCRMPSKVFENARCNNPTNLRINRFVTKSDGTYYYVYVCEDCRKKEEE